MTSQIAVIRATLRYTTQEELIAGMKPLLSKRGLFIYTRTTRPVGSPVRFEFTLADGSQTYAGEGVVRREIPYSGDSSSQKSGMLVCLQRVNRPFKAVVDAVLEQSETERRTTGKQFIVESRVGEHQGFDLFGDIDLDEGLNSLFSGIAKKPESTENKSGLYVPPTVVSGMFRAPDEEITLEYHNDDKHVPATPQLDSSLGERLGSRRAGLSMQEKFRAITGQYSSVVDNIASAERQAAQAKFNAVDARSPSGEFDESPTVNEMQAIAETHAYAADGDVLPHDPALDVSSASEGNMFGDALDFDHSPVVQRMEREFEFERRSLTRDETPVHMEQIVADAYGEQPPLDRHPGEIDHDEPHAFSADDTFAPTSAEAAAFASEGEFYSAHNVESEQNAEHVNSQEIYPEHDPLIENSFDSDRADVLDHNLPYDAVPNPDNSPFIDREQRDAVERCESNTEFQNNSELYSEPIESVESNSEPFRESAQDANELHETAPAYEADPIPAAIPERVPSPQEAQTQLFPTDDGAQETPSELFEALQADILGLPSGDVPSIEPTPQESNDSPDIDDLATVTLPPQRFETAPQPQPQPVTFASLAEENAPVPPPRREISLDELISQPPTPHHSTTPHHPTPGVQQSTTDLINTDMSTVSRPVPRRRDIANSAPAEVPTPKKGGFFSNLFKR